MRGSRGIREGKEVREEQGAERGEYGVVILERGRRGGGAGMEDGIGEKGWHRGSGGEHEQW